MACLAAAFSMFLPTGCDMIDYHPYDTRVHGEHGVNARNVARIEEACTGKHSIRFAMISDTQRWYDETESAVRSINAREDVDFVIHCGDISDFGVTKEFELQRDILSRLRVPYVVLIGNHDCLGSGGDTYRYVFGNPDFAFRAGDTQFLCLNTNAFEYDYSTNIPDFSFIRAVRQVAWEEEGIRRTVVSMHSQPLGDQFNNNVADIFEEEITKYPNLLFCLCGHGHKQQVADLFGDGVYYYEIGAAKARKYYLFTLTSDGGYTYEVVEY